jgi:hypothetical protein
MTTIAVRGYVKKIIPANKSNWISEDPPLRHNRILAFDTETTRNETQNFKIGSFQIFDKNYLVQEGHFYNPLMLDAEECETARIYVDETHRPLYTHEEFIDQVFYPEVYKRKTLCVGFNLPFDISRLAYQIGKSHKHNGGFTQHLSQNPFNPPIIISQLGQASSINFHRMKGNPFTGYFLDIQTLVKILLKLKSLSLKETGKALNTRHQKIEGIEHGRVTKEYIDYNINDVRVTSDSYFKLVDQLDSYQVEIPITKIYSDASIGKAVLKQFGIKSFLESQPDFPPELLGQIMTAYYGGRTECMIRKTPVRITDLDFSSTYPTITTLLGLDQFITATGIDFQDVTNEVRELLPQVDLKYVQNPANWKDFVVQVKILPNKDILPVRMKYKKNDPVLNVGINYLISEEPIWASLPDVISSKLSTGKTPEVIEAIRFTPQGQQPTLKPSTILGTCIDPRKDNLVKFFVEERQRIQQQKNKFEKNSPEWKQLDGKQHALKIIVNAMSYGIFIELNPDDKKIKAAIFGLDNFEMEKVRFEKPGRYFHPLLAVMITGGTRLFLAMAEAKLKQLGTCHAYTDTDSLFVHPDYSQPLIDYFQPLNPYGENIPLLKIEEGKENVWFYGISSKRYALYHYNYGKIELVDYMLHGLGYLTNPYPKSNNPDWHKEFWMDILEYHYSHNMQTAEKISQKYNSCFGVSKIDISTSNVLRRFEKYNKEKDWNNQIKPCNFFLTGFHIYKDKKTGKIIKPIAPYSTDPQSIVDQPFIDYETGEIRQGRHYFKTLTDIFFQYIQHRESKYKGDTGFLERQFIHSDKIIHIGKEVNNLDKEILEINGAQLFINEKEIAQKILSIRQCQAEKAGVDHRVLNYTKNKIRTGQKINLKTKAVKRLLKIIGE